MQPIAQFLGIPLGTSCSVFAANLFCFACDFDVIVQLVNMNRMDRGTFFFRDAHYMDDLFLFG